MKVHRESHRLSRVGWLRAAVLGANDGLISTSSLVVGMAAADAGAHAVVLAGLAGLVAGSFSMAAGEFVSVSSQADAEDADLARERRELAAAPEAERRELAGIYVDRGLKPALAEQVATAMMDHDALAAHARDELGIVEFARARPVQAAFTSAASFALGALPPLAVATVMGGSGRRGAAGVALVALALLVVLGAAAARLGGASVPRGAGRVVLWGAIAMGCTALVGHFFGNLTGLP